MNRLEEVEKELNHIVAIIKRINPVKIYLFGSIAGGSPDEESDIDLLIVAPSEDRPLERRIKLRQMLKDYDRRIGLDLLVYTPEEFKMLENQPSSFIYSALKKGKKIYERETA